MKLARIHIASVLLAIGLCQAQTSGRDRSKVDDAHRYDVDYSDDADEETSTEPDILKEEQSEEELPILPPIILLDFGNGTENENATSEEKSKRTVNNGIGYGLEKNSLHSGRYNYYFPGGKSGTTVSIEESISPFLPKTIIEKLQPNQRNAARPFAIHNVYGSPSVSQSHSNFQYLAPELSKAQSVYGVRTKLQKAPASSNYESYQNFMSTPKPGGSSFVIQNLAYRNNIVSTTSAPPLAFSPTEPARYVTPNSLNYAGLRGNSFNYATPSPFPRQPNAQTYVGQRQSVQFNANPQNYAYHGQTAEASTVRPASAHFPRPAAQLPNTPRYTIENGVRYENKIFWKYPDGRVSDVPPATYVETYSDYPQQTQPLKSQSSGAIYESGPQDNVYSQGPVQFPTTPESTGQEPNAFVSSESLSSSLPQQQVYRLGYQNLLAQKQNANLAQQEGKPEATADVSASYTFASSALSRTKAKTNRHKPNYISASYVQPQTSKYMVNSPNPEYTDYTTEPSVNVTTPSSFFTATGDDRKQHSNKDLESYSNLQYSDLLNYNPSISQYIRNPASILNVQPTFVQAGNSLIPVIILRVDGASPIQPKATPNINLKALLQQYLVQYANSIQELARPSSYDLGTESAEKVQSVASGRNPIFDLIRLTQNDAREGPSYLPSMYQGKSSYDTSNLEKSLIGNKYSERYSARQKVKNVQIVDDSRFATYKTKN